VHAVAARIERTSPVVDAESYAARAVPPSFDRVPPSGPVPPVVTTPPALADRAPIGAEAAPLFVDPAPVISSSPSIDRPPASAPGAMSIAQVIDSSMRALSVLRLKVSTVISVSRTADGWQVTAELVERRSVPDTSDLLGVYELLLDEGGNLLKYERTRMRRRCDLGR